MSSPSQSLGSLLDETVRAIRAKVPNVAPRVGVVLGSGLGAFADSLEGLVKVSYADIPHLPASRVVGHAGNLCFGTSHGVPVVCMQGRAHLYEGHGIQSVVHGVRAMAKLGVSCVLLTNAAGGIEPTWSAGDLMVVTDHLNLMGTSPLLGPNDESIGPRFPDMSHAYDPELRAALLDVGRASKIALREGIYAGLLGPSYETPAEVRMLRGLGAHAVGMSTVHEVIALRHMGVRVGALSCITNLAAGITKQTLDHKEVEETARARREDLLTLLGGWIARAGEMTNAKLMARLIAEAKKVRKRAYAPYSKYFVGAAIASKSGKIYVGCNVENASYGACLCAERNAVAAMVAAGETVPVACAVVTAGPRPGSPCGICRQVLFELAADMPIALVADGPKVKAGGARRDTTLAELLPDGFHLLRRSH